MADLTRHDCLVQRNGRVWLRGSMSLLGTVLSLRGWRASCSGCGWHGEFQSRRIDAVNDLVEHVNDVGRTAR